MCERFSSATLNCICVCVLCAVYRRNDHSFKMQNNNKDTYLLYANIDRLAAINDMYAKFMQIRSILEASLCHTLHTFGSALECEHQGITILCRMPPFNVIKLVLVLKLKHNHSCDPAIPKKKTQTHIRRRTRTLDVCIYVGEQSEFELKIASNVMLLGVNAFVQRDTLVLL